MLEIKRSFFLVFGFRLTDGLLVRERIVAELSICEFYPVVCHMPKQYQNLLVQICSHTQKMNSISKKNAVPTRKTAPQTKTLKRSKSTELLPSKKNSRKTRIERDQSEDTITNTHSLAKSKSAKSIKSKQHTQHKSQPSGKKPKGKKKLESKTTKKQAKRQLNDSSSFLTEQFKTVKPTNEYFIYCNNYIPIQNSAQRRLVYKIQMIDMEHKSTVDSFNLTRVENKDVATEIREVGRVQEDKEDKGVSTDVREMKEIAVGNVIVNNHEETQTERNSYEQSADKCFADVLTELEFLYMPNQNNFQPFTQDERLHYGEMLQALAKKMLSGCKNVVIDRLTDDQITVLIYQREGIQVGALEYIPLEGFPTHLLAVLAYLKNLFCFIDYSYKEEVIANLRQFYGYNYNQRVNRLSRKLPHQKDRKSVLSPQIFKNFEEQMFKDYQFPNELVKQAVHIHNRAVFDAVNAELQVFRPFYLSQGEPFPWSINLGMTHYDITEEALYIIFMQIKEKIQKQMVTLCGMHLDFDDKDLPSAHTSPFYVKKMQEKINRMAIDEFKSVDDSVAIDYEKTALRFDVQQQIFYELISQLEDELMAIVGQKHNEEESDFQYFF